MISYEECLILLAEGFILQDCLTPPKKIEYKDEFKVADKIL